jgi:hypothetical protein
MLGLVTGLRQGWQAGLGSGVTCGFLFGLLIATFMQRQAKNLDKLRPRYEKEGLVLCSPANLGGAGGWLFLTKQRLAFEPHKINLGGKHVSIPLADVHEVRPASGKLVRRFEVVTAKATHSFLVENRDEWLAAFTPLLGKTSSAQS